MTRTTKTTTRKPTYVTNTNAKGAKTGVSNNSRGTKTTVVKNAAGTTYTKVTNAAGKTFTKATDSKGNVISPNANKVNVNANKVKVNANKVGINAAKVRANSAKVAANAASVKANATKAKVTPKVTATKPLANNKVKMGTVVGTPTTGTRGKSYLVTTNKGYDQWGTAAQADSATASIYKWNNPERYTKGDLNKRFPGETSQRGRPTKQGLANNPVGYSRMSQAQKDALPDYVPPKNTGAGPLRRASEVKGATGTGGCSPGYRLDFNGNCVKN